MRRTTLLVAAVVLAAVAVGVVAADDVTDIGTDHDLASDDAMERWSDRGYAEGDVDRYQIELAVAESRADVGAEDAAVTNIRNQFLRIDYQEDYERTLRILIPRDVITPYKTTAGSLTSPHEATLSPARSGEYLEVVVEVDGESDIVLPLNRDHAISYSLIERTDKRIERLTGVSPLDREHDWEYVDGDEFTGETHRINHSLDEMALQFDATPERTDETWVNVPVGERGGAGVYVLDTDAKHDGNTTLVTTLQDPPEIRYRTESTLPAQVRGWVSEARTYPGDVMDRLEDILPFLGD